MSALSELQSGQAGEAFVALVSRTIRAVAIARNFPPPEGHYFWDSDAVLAMTAEFFASPQTSRRLVDLGMRGATEAGLRRLLQTTIRNFLADVGRRTHVGRLVRRINDVLGDDPAFERDGDSWILSGMGSEDAAVDLEDLVALASDVAVTTPTAWRKSSRRKSPDVDRDSVVRLARVLLTHVGGPLPPSVMAQVVARRLGIGQMALTIDATAFDPPLRDCFTGDTTAGEAIATIRAREVLDRLNDSELVAVGLAETSAATLADLLGTGKSTAALVRTRAVAVIRAELCGEEHGEQTAEVVMNMARKWATTRMSGRDAT